jgi:predicted nucleic acid-binding Zn ribbon protein
MKELEDDPLPKYEIACAKCKLEFEIYQKLDRGTFIECPICRGPAYLTDPETAQEWERFNEV